MACVQIFVINEICAPVTYKNTFEGKFSIFVGQQVSVVKQLVIFASHAAQNNN